MNQPVIVNLFLRQGYPYSKTWTWETNGQDVNLGSYTAQITFIDRSDDILLTLSTTLDANDSGIVLDSTGDIALTINPETLADITFSKARYKLDLTPSDGEPIPFLSGVAYVKQGYSEP